MTRARIAVAIALAMVVTAVLATPARGQGAARLDLVAQTTFVGDDPAVIDVRVLGAPTGAVVRVRIHEAVTTRAGLADSLAGQPPTGVIGRWTEDDLDSIRVGAGDVISLEVPDDEIGELLRRPADAGPHPLVIELVVGDRVLDSLVTHLLVLPPAESTGSAHLTVALMLDLGMPLTLMADGTTNIDAAPLDRAVELASALAARVELPLTVALPPEGFESLAAHALADPLAILRTASVGNQVLMAPWVDIDEEAWRAGGRADLVEVLYERGRESMAAGPGIESGSVIALDPTATPETISLLVGDRIGATGFVLDDDGVIGVPEEATAPVSVVDGNGVSHPAVLPDGFLESLVTGPDPELAVQHTLAELLRMALATDDGPSGVVIAPDEIDLIALDLLLDGLDQPSPLVPGTIDDVLRLPLTDLGAGQPVSARLASVPTEDLGDHLVARADLEARLAAYASLIRGNEVLIEPLDDILLASVARSAAGTRAGYLELVAEQVDAGLQGVELVDTGRVTITSRRASLPVVIRNDQTLPIRVALTLSAEKIDFPDGERQLMTLQPGENEVGLEVVALASGDSAINLRIESPEGEIALATGVVRLRSTAISGLGLLISVVALAVLVGWWIQTIRRRRRDRRDPPGSVAAAPGESGDEQAEEPIHGHRPAEGT